VRALCAVLAALFAFTAITTHRTHHIDYRTPAHHTTKD
jgi:hypothetical protein